MPPYAQSLLTLCLVLLPLFIGFALPVTPRMAARIDAWLGGLVYVILTLVGIELAQVSNLLHQLPTLLTYVAALAALTLLCGTATLVVFDRLRPSRSLIKAARSGVNPSSKAQTIGVSGMSGVNSSIKQVGCVGVGLIIGRELPPALLPLEHSMTALLMLLILLVGMGLKAADITLKQVLLNKRGVQTSVVFVLATLLAGAMFGVLYAEVSVYQGLALASGFGWYSLSAIIMTDAYGPLWGSVALFNDLLREFVALTCIPWLMRRHPSAAVGLGGATSLDFTLPVIQHSGGLAVVPLAISFGFIINIVSPILMVLFSSLG